MMAAVSRDDEGNFTQEYTDEELFEVVRTLAAKYGRPPTATEFDDWSDISYGSPTYRFGSWLAFIRAAGLDPDGVPNKRQQYTDAECLEWIEAFVEYFGVVPACGDPTGWPGPSAKVYERRYGSVAQAVREAGYEPRGDA